MRRAADLSPGALMTAQAEAMRSLAGLSVMLAEAQAVMLFRLWGMAGLWAVAPGETRRMVTEKLPAFTEAGHAATRAAMTGASPAGVLSAATKPLHRRTGPNAKRLARRGPKYWKGGR